MAKRIWSTLGLVVALLALAACAAPTPTPAPTPTATRAPAPTATLVPAPTATRAPAPTASPTQAPPPTAAPTATPVPASTATRVPTPTATPTPVPTATPVPVVLTLQWLGHSAFLIETSTGTRVLTDPPDSSVGYAISPIPRVDAVTVGHEHSDHNNVSLAQGTPQVLRGLTAGGDWAAIDTRVKDVSFRTVGVNHDEAQGSVRGKNAVFVIVADGLRLAHLSDLGHTLTPQQVTAIGPVDVLLIPVGDVYTINSALATQVVAQLNPRVVVPMHYKTARLSSSLPLVGVEPFLAGKRVERPGSNLLRLSAAALPAETTVFVLNYE